MEKVIKVTQEKGTATITLKSGRKIVVNTNTTYTIYSNGRKDCNVEIQDPVPVGAVGDKPGVLTDNGERTL